jgi:hypothetical protein
LTQPDEPSPRCDLDCFGAARDAELLEQVSDVGLRRVLADAERVGDLLVRLPIGEQAQRGQLAPVARASRCPGRGRPSPACTPKSPAQGVLYQVVRDHFETFRAEAGRVDERDALPRFIEEEFRGFLRSDGRARGAPGR